MVFDPHRSRKRNPLPHELIDNSSGVKDRSFSFEHRILAWLLAAGIAVCCPCLLLLHRLGLTRLEIAAFTCLLVGAYTQLARLFFKQLLRPLQTLANIIAAIREEDYSFRARRGRRGDTVGDLTLEVNALSSTLQRQRAEVQDALSLLERVLTSMHSPVVAFDNATRLRVINSAARETFALGASDPIGRTAAELQLDQLLALPDQGLYPGAATLESPVFKTSAAIRWSVRRTTFRLHGLPHTLLVLSDVAAVLREEERLAWQRLIRVLSHEINNSLTPISSIAGSLARLTERLPLDAREDFERGLFVIEDRAASLNRFLQAYQRLAHLPAPTLQAVSAERIVTSTAQMETRMPLNLVVGETVIMLCDPDQVQQALINLLQNAVDAALAHEAESNTRALVTFTWTVTAAEITFVIEDSGLGIEDASNLFVPFYTTKPKGSGIGLVLAQQIASAHHGRVAILSSKTKPGCTATLSLPLSRTIGGR
ncbi:PAS domain-containing sensor histidine kinase [Acidipila sp. EB88]|uniref:sensor histidine kinase n=1 Tax=Acidipila sp. EB88 TaxID=2305226 RepID=UPI000F5FFF5A|nr:ATP-binding protein [Acidipila sp. EB88]RRA49770.1 ATP-binding protein [Acidipila sp. EB88]